MSTNIGLRLRAFSHWAQLIHTVLRNDCFPLPRWSEFTLFLCTIPRHACVFTPSNTPLNMRKNEQGSCLLLLVFRSRATLMHASTCISFGFVDIGENDSTNDVASEQQSTSVEVSFQLLLHLI